MTSLLQELSANEIRQLLMMERQFKKLFDSVRQHMFVVSQERGIDPRVMRLGMATRCLMMAAEMHPGSRDVFMNDAGHAFATTHHETQDKNNDQ